MCETPQSCGLCETTKSLPFNRLLSLKEADASTGVAAGMHQSAGIAGHTCEGSPEIPAIEGLRLKEGPFHSPCFSRELAKPGKRDTELCGIRSGASARNAG